MTATVATHLRSLSEERVMSAKDALEVIFPETRTRKAARLFVSWLSKNGGQATKNAVSNFANSLQDGHIDEKIGPFKYSRRNFYMTVIRTLVDMGFIRRNVPIWDSSRRKTLYVYSRNIFDIPEKPPSVGFWRISFYVCRKWNNMFSDIK